MKTLTSSTNAVSASETTDAQNASAVFILKEQNGGTNGALSPNMKSFTLKRNGMKNEEQENGHQILEQKSATLPAAVSESKKKIALSKKGKTFCQNCKKKCSGEVLRVQDKYFHINCFKCQVCKNSLAQGGFFCKDGNYYCTADYQRQFGTKCAKCGDYVEGEVVSALGNTYHQKCFTCARCRQPFPSGQRVTYTGKEVLCQKCVQIPVRETQTLQASPSSINGPECAGCQEELKEGQALIALERQWHIWCFKCRTCDSVLHGEYMGKDGIPYCEKDYQKQFGVKCAYCNRYISGKVLQAGDNHHFHPTCARCTKCGDPFGDGEEMYLQGTAIWHPRCGPGPTENGTVLNGSLENGHCTDGESGKEGGREFDHMSSSAVSELQRTGSPGLILREYKNNQYPDDISRIYTYSYLTEEPTQGYLKRPIDPYDKPPTSPHFHRPSSANSRSSGKFTLNKASSKSGMKVLVDSIRTEMPRPRSPHMNNEEPIELAHFPAAKRPGPGEQPKIERDDFPAPPYPYTDPERRRRWSDTYKGVPDSDEEDEVDGKENKDNVEKVGDKKLKKEEEELSKIATGIGKVFLQNVREREKLRQWKLAHIDPRNASRTPSAAHEPVYRLRYESPVNASPSRNVDHPRPWEDDELMDRSSSYRSSVGRSVGTIPSYNVVSSLRAAPKPGYGLKSSTLPATGRNGGPAGFAGDFSFSGLGDKTHSTEFSSGKSDISAGSISEVDRRGLNSDIPVSTTFAGGLRYAASYSPHLRRSLPNMAHPMSTEPAKIYPYHLLLITNYRLPADVDRLNLERHLSDTEFEALFQCNRVEFYRLPQWRRNDIKRRARLF
ncbi:actin-binding LIM protein 3 isoform X4 [Zootermopsis nevadensis]|uniref:actin-binding LIM protein 3 isoform X4 n=1 Tax=Zootermopsis nevadensis TaxID=136037 RepID=UPI000B8E41A8|nr:actin-binding LIM protein 3 isoform X4 [Zootermopsis nevadensis]